jgi:hypothetical protein
MREKEGSYLVLKLSGIVRGNEKGTHCLWGGGVQLGHPVPGGYKSGDLVLQVGGLSNLSSKLDSNQIFSKIAGISILNAIALQFCFGY